MSPAITISAEQWADMCSAFMVMFALCWVMSISWIDWFFMIERRIIRRNRRRRIAAIRARKASLQA